MTAPQVTIITCSYNKSGYINVYSPNALGKYIMYLVDDDILEPTCFEDHLKVFQRNKAQKANYHAYKIVYLGTNRPDDISPATKTFGPLCGPKERMDGGSLMFEKDILSQITRPYFKHNWFNAHISDSLFLDKLSKTVSSHPINKILHTKRITPISVHTYINDGGMPWFFRPRYGFDRSPSSGKI